MEYPQIGKDRQLYGSARTGQGEGGQASRRLEPFSPLLHDLITWDLVCRGESGRFVLRDDVQQWLEEVSARQAASAPPEVYVGRPCQRCGTIGVTRMVTGMRVCDACSRVPAGDEVEHSGKSASKRNRHHETRPWRARRAG